MKRSSKSEFIKKAKFVHHNKNYDYSKVIYKNNYTKVEIGCPMHVLFEQKPLKHLEGQGCPECGKDLQIKKLLARATPFETFIEQANKAHPNNPYSYDKVNYVNTLTKITITCPVHGDFDQAPGDHIRGRGCLKCSGNVSKGELEWLASLGLSDTKTTIRIGDRRFRVDGYDAATNTVYEYNGDFWHGNPAKHAPDKMNKKAKCTMGELYDATIKKEAIIRDAGYNLISIWESDWLSLQKQRNRLL